MKEKIIELIKRTKIYPFLKSILFQTKEKDYKQNLLTPLQTNKYISELLVEGKPFIMSRLGSSELSLLKSFVKKNKYTVKQKTIIQRNAGFFPTDDKSLDMLCQLYIDVISSIDLVGVSFIPFEDHMINSYSPNAKLTKIRNLEPYFYNEPWSKHLKGKKVLVIHPFASSIQSQFKKRKLLFKDLDVLPEFKLITYQAAQTLGGGDGTFTSWFNALETMQKDIEKLEFDIAIIGAGVYGLPLAAYIKGLGKSAIHLGGATQMLFGVYGRRWEIHPDFKDMINENWIKPQVDEKPKNANNVENACYW